MGITIHYRGRLDHPERIVDLTKECADFCGILHWPCDTFDDCWETAPWARLDRTGSGLEIAGNLGLKGILFKPHENSESVSLCCDARGFLYSPAVKAFQLEEGAPEETPQWISVKTQFAPPSTHIAIVKLLRHIKNRYVGDLEVNDEGGYYETGNADQLASGMERLRRLMDALEARLRGMEKISGEGLTDEEHLQRVERAIIAAAKNVAMTDREPPRGKDRQSPDSEDA